MPIVDKDGYSVNQSLLGGSIVGLSQGNTGWFFPEQIVAIKGVDKKRGVSHFCFPAHGATSEEFGLPQHGPLRDVEGRIKGSNVVFDSKGLLGNSGRDCHVVTGVTVVGGSVRHSLYARLKEPGEAVRISPGLHPYIATPNGEATVTSGNRVIKVRGLLTESVHLPLEGFTTVAVAGVGVIGIMPSFKRPEYPNAGLVIWRDDLQYVCVEPIMAPARLYGTDQCPELRHDKLFKMSCAYYFAPGK